MVARNRREERRVLHFELTFYTREKMDKESQIYTDLSTYSPTLPGAVDLDGNTPYPSFKDYLRQIDQETANENSRPFPHNNNRELLLLFFLALTRENTWQCKHSREACTT